MARRSGDGRQSRIFRESPRFASGVWALGQRLRELRQSKEWTLEQAAEQMQVDLKHLQKIEAGQINVTLATLLRMADGLGEPLAQLFITIPRPERSRKK